MVVSHHGGGHVLEAALEMVGVNMGEFGPWHIAIVVLVLVVLFGSKRLPGAAKSIGQSMKIFKDETKGLRGDAHAGHDYAGHDHGAHDHPVQAPPAQLAAPQAVVVPPAAPPAPVSIPAAPVAAAPPAPQPAALTPPSA
jgi:sec-independent protein translocase protein TatA